MNAQPPNKDKTKQAKTEAPLAIDFDVSEFMHFLDGTDWNDEQKAEYITLVWEIVFDLVMCGVIVKAPDDGQNGCGKLPENASDKGISPHSMVNSSHSQLIEEFTRLNPDEGRSDEKEVTDG